MDPIQTYLSHADGQGAFRDAFPGILDESDRGAVLIAADAIHEQLRKLFEALFPIGVSARHRRDMLDGHGPLATLSARIEIAYAARLLDVSLRKCLHVLRRLRNKIAHSGTQFSLAEHSSDLERLYALGTDIPRAINELALALMLESVTSKVLDAKLVRSDGTPVFSSPQEVVDHLISSPELTERMRKRLLRWELAVATGLMGAMIVHYREKARAVLPSEGLWAELGGAGRLDGSKPSGSSDGQ